MKGRFFSILILSHLIAFPQTDTLWFCTPGKLKCDTFYLVEFQATSRDEKGKCISKYSSGDQAAEVYYEFDHQKYGSYRSYYPNGNLREFSVYTQGRKNGEYSLYDANGELLIKGRYRSGIMHGYWAFKKEGCFGRFKQGLKHGKWKCYDSGKLVSERLFRKGEPAGSGDPITTSDSLSGGAIENPAHRQTRIDENKSNNPRFRENVYPGIEVEIYEKNRKSGDPPVTGLVKDVLSKAAFNPRGIRVKLENGKKGWVVKILKAH